MFRRTNLKPPVGIQESRGPLRRHLPETRRCAAARHRRRRLCTPSQLNSSLGEHHTDLLSLFAPMVWHKHGPNARAGEASLRRPAAAAASTAPDFPEPSLVPRRVRSAALNTQTLARVDLTPGRPDLAKSGEFPAAPPRNRAAGDVPPPPRAQINPSRQISSQRLRLDRDPVYPEPSDPNPAIQI